MEGLGERIKELRNEKGITQPQLAKALNVSNAVISFWENNINAVNSVPLSNSL